MRATGAPAGVVRALSAARRATPCRCCRRAATSTGVTTDGLAFPLSDEPLALGSTRGVSNVIGRPRRDRRRPARAPARDRVACYPLTMSMPDVGDVAPEVALPDETGTVHRPGRPARPLDDPLLLPEGRHARLHRRGVRVPRQQRDDPRARRGRLGRQPAGGRLQARVPREVRPAVHPARRRGPRRRRGVRLVGREAELRQDLLGHGADDVPGRSGRAASRGSGRRSSRRVTPPTCWPRSTSSRRPHAS